MATNKKAISWNLEHCDRGGREAISFKYLAKPRILWTKIDPRSFPRLLDFPPDILLLILRACDATTLFQLMHTCSLIRREALKLFWTHPDVWFGIGEKWWYDWLSNTPPADSLDEFFAMKMRQISILGKPIVEALNDFFVFNPPSDGLSKEERVAIFWQGLRKSFPSVRKVVLKTTPLTSTTPAFEANPDPYWGEVMMLCQQAPRDLQVFIAAGNRVHWKYPEYSLWSFSPLTEPEFHLLERPWVRPLSICLPPQPLPEGPLRDFEHMSSLGARIDNEEAAYEWLKKQTFRLLDENGGIACPYPGCERVFPEREEWDFHFERCRFRQRMVWSENTPPQVAALLEDKDIRIAALRHRRTAAWLKLRLAIGNKEAEKRKFHKKLRKQVRKLLYPGKWPRKDTDVQEYLDYFWECFDQSGPDYGPDLYHVVENHLPRGIIVDPMLMEIG